MENKKVCSKCGESKDFREYSPNQKSKDKLQSNCKSCHAEIGRIWRTKNLQHARETARNYMREWRKRNPDKARAAKKKLYDKNRDKILEQKHIKYVENRKRVIANYGGKCNCCREDNYYFLTIDHINNDGYIHRKEYKGNMFSWAIKNNFPNSLQILCFNCNSARQWYGGKDKICPHKFNNKLKDKGRRID